MPTTTMEFPHSLGQEEAVRRLKEKTDLVTGTYGDQVSDLQQTWSDNELAYGFRVMGMRIAGTVTVDDSRVRLETQVPFAALMFKGKIESRVKEEMTTLLA